MTAVYEYDKYITTSENLNETLEKYGVAIIPSVLNEEECDEMENGMWDTLEYWTQHWDTKITRDNPESWRNIRDLLPKHSMLIQQYKLGHAQFIWNLRQNLKCIDIFSNLWSCSYEDLLVSFDAASFHMPSEVTQIGWYKKTWFHCDLFTC